MKCLLFSLAKSTKCGSDCAHSGSNEEARTVKIRNTHIERGGGRERAWFSSLCLCVYFCAYLGVLITFSGDYDEYVCFAR